VYVEGQIRRRNKDGKDRVRDRDGLGEGTS